MSHTVKGYIVKAVIFKNRFVGFMYGGGTITSCENRAKITASDAYAGGMVGRIEDDRCTFTDNTNSGSVSAPKYCGNTCGYDGKTKTTY